LNKEVPANKMANMLMSFYGRGWNLKHGSGTGYYQAATQPLPHGTIQ